MVPGLKVYMPSPAAMKEVGVKDRPSQYNFTLGTAPQVTICVIRAILYKYTQLYAYHPAVSEWGQYPNFTAFPLIPSSLLDML